MMISAMTAVEMKVRPLFGRDVPQFCPGSVPLLMSTVGPDHDRAPQPTSD